VTALLVVVLATTAAVAMAKRFHYTLRYSENMLHADQALLYLQGVEDWVGQLLIREAAASQTDHLNEQWAQEVPPIPVDGGILSGRLEDQQGRFNLNRLAQDAEGRALAQLRRLLQTLGLESDLADAIKDWIDSDGDVTYPGGAEDGHYAGMVPPYRPANRPLVLLNELRLVSGVDDEILTILAPHVTVLPPLQTPININTASVEVLMSLHADLTRGDGEALVEARGEEGYGTVADFLNQHSVRERGLIAAELSVTSHYFVLTSAIQFGRLTNYFHTLLHRQGDRVSVVRRSRGEGL
jgi:general secretion pathway protein K